MNIWESLKQKLSSHRVLTLAVLATSIFFALYKLTTIPPGTQNDVIRSSLTAEQFLNNLDGDGTSLRQIIAYFINGGYWTYLIGDVFRSTFNFNVLTIISRLPAAIFFVSTALIWLNMLRLMKFSKTGIVLFFMIFLPSSLYITYSHHIPLVGGYFFFTSSAIYYFMRFLLSKHADIHYLCISLGCTAAATYTHGISVFFSLLFFPFFIILMFIFNSALIQHKRALLRQNTLKSLLLLTGSFLVTGTLLFPFFQGFLGSDRSLQTRDATTIKYLIENGESRLALQKTGIKIWSYISPNTLIWSGNLVRGSQPIESPEFFDIKNAQFNQWVTTNLSPFGIITAIIFVTAPLVLVGILFKIFPERFNVPALLFISLSATYVLLPIFPNYDNPSVAKALPALMFIPLGITFIVQYLTNGDKHSYLWYIFLFSAGLNMIYNLGYLYSDRYQLGETQKYYQYNTISLANDIAKAGDLHSTRLYLSTANADVQNALSYFFSSYLLDRMVYGQLDLSTIDPKEHTLVVTNDEDIVEALQNTGFFRTKSLYRKPSGAIDYYLVELGTESEHPISAPIVLGETYITCAHETYYPFYTGETEYLIHQHRYYPDSETIQIEDCNSDFLNSTNYLNVKDMTYKSGKLQTSIAPDLWGKQVETLTQDKAQLTEHTYRNVFENKVTYSFSDTKDVTDRVEYNAIGPSEYRGDSISLIASKYPGKASITLSSEILGFGTYLIEFDYNKSKFSYLDVYVLDSKEKKNIAANLLSQDYDPTEAETYRTVFYLPAGSTYAVGLDLFNRHLNLDKDKHTVTAEIDSITITKLTSDNLLSIAKQLVDSQQPEIKARFSATPTIDEIFPGLIRILDVPERDEATTIVLNQPFSRSNVVLGTNTNVHLTLANGISQAVQIKSANDLQAEVYIVNLGWVTGAAFLVAFVGIPSFLFFYKRKVLIS